MAAVTAFLGGFAAPAAASPEGLDGVITNARTEQPVADAQVIVHDRSGGWVDYTFTDAAGHYELPALAPGEYLVEVSAYQMVSQWAYGKQGYWDADPITSPGTVDLALMPVEYGSLSGRFVTSAGAPVASALVEVYTTTQNQRASTSTDATGAFRFDGLQTGGYKLRFTTPGGSAQWAHQKEEFSFDLAETFTVEADQETVMTETAFPVGSLEVTVVDTETAEPIAGACVNSRGGPQQISGCTDAEGRTRMDDIRTGTYSVSIAPPEGYLYGTIDDIVVAEGQTTSVTGDLTKAAVIAVSVEDARTHRPVTTACVSIVDDDGIVYPQPHCTGADGKIRLDRWIAGEFRVYAFTNDNSLGAQWVGSTGGTGDMRRAKMFTTTAGATTDVTIKLDPAGSITGVVRSADGNTPVEGLCPSVTPVSVIGPSMIHTFCSQADGTYTLSGLGPYQWPVQFPDFSGKHAWIWSGNAADRFAATPVRVRPGRSTTVNATLPLAGKLTGTIIDATLPNEWITVYAANTRTGDPAGPYARVTGTAQYTLSGLATQNVWIDYNGNTGPGNELARYPDPVSVTIGQTTHLDLPIPD